MLPNFPSIPTDNLYKFMALSGLIIAILGFGFQHVDDEKWYTKTKIMDVELELIEKDAANLNGLIKGLSETELPLEMNQKLYEENAELKKRLANFEKKFAPMNSPGSQKLYSRAGNAGFFGVFLSALGFGLWYFRVQRLLDRLLNLLLLDAENKHKDAPAVKQFDSSYLLEIEKTDLLDQSNPRNGENNL